MKDIYGKAALAVGGSLLAVLGLSKKLIVRRYTQVTPKVTAPVRLAVLTDLHSTFYGKDQAQLIQMLRKAAPDGVLMAGDMADDVVPHQGIISLIGQIGGQYPCFYVTGNHECRSGQLETIKTMFREAEVTVLSGQLVQADIGGQRLEIAGVEDPVCLEAAGADAWSGQLKACQRAGTAEAYRILLTHRPERVDAYRDSGFDLVLAGHAHGGQVRFPGLINGLFAPQQGLLPRYAGGRYDLGETTLIVSRGLCKNYLPRVFNRPEVVLIELWPEEAF